MLIIFFLIIILSGIIYWLLLKSINDFDLPEIDLYRYRNGNEKLKIMTIFPHPDDETVPIGGTLAKYARRKDVEIKVIVATHGDAGETNSICSNSDLSEFRKKELVSAINALGVSAYEIWDFKDGNLNKSIEVLKDKVDEALQGFRPDVVFTFDESGLYGHPDHIALSNVVSSVVKKSYNRIKLLYVTLSAKQLDKVDLPVHMAENVDDLKKRRLPEYKSTYWMERYKKLKAMRLYKSQNLAKHFKPFPLWFLIEFAWIEYISED